MGSAKGPGCERVFAVPYAASRWAAQSCAFESGVPTSFHTIPARRRGITRSAPSSMRSPRSSFRRA